MTDTIDKASSFDAPTKQATRYLGSCAPIVMAWHQRLLEIKNKAQQQSQEEDDSTNVAYLQFFRTTISASDAAKLKRCQHMDDVAMQPAFIALWQQVESRLFQNDANKQSTLGNKTSDNTFAAWLAVAWVLSQVRTVDNRNKVASAGKNKRQLDNTLARVAGQHQDDRALITPLRFEKLISARHPDNFVSLLARMVAQLQQQGHSINIIWLTNDILHWFVDFQGSNYRTPRDKLTVQWSLTYYQVNI